MTEVRVRDTMEGDVRSLGDVPLDQVDNVIPLLKSWGIYCEAHRGYVDPDLLSGEFRHDQSGCYFLVNFEY